MLKYNSKAFIGGRPSGSLAHPQIKSVHKPLKPSQGYLGVANDQSFKRGIQMKMNKDASLGLGSSQLVPNYQSSKYMSMTASSNLGRQQYRVSNLTMTATKPKQQVVLLGGSNISTSVKVQAPLPD